MDIVVYWVAAVAGPPYRCESCTVLSQCLTHHTGVKAVVYFVVAVAGPLYRCESCTVLSQCLTYHTGVKVVVYFVVAVASPPAEDGHGDVEEHPRNPCSHASADGAALRPEGKSQW